MFANPRGTEERIQRKEGRANNHVPFTALVERDALETSAAHNFGAFLQLFVALLTFLGSGISATRGFALVLIAASGRPHGAETLFLALRRWAKFFAHQIERLVFVWAPLRFEDLASTCFSITAWTTSTLLHVAFVKVRFTVLNRANFVLCIFAVACTLVVG
jgi:hypothetical protein